MPLIPQMIEVIALYRPRSSSVASALVSAGMTGDSSVSPTANTTAQPITPSAASSTLPCPPATPPAARISQEPAKITPTAASA
jgi:hypothetical protein